MVTVGEGLTVGLTVAVAVGLMLCARVEDTSARARHTPSSRGGVMLRQGFNPFETDVSVKSGVYIRARAEESRRFDPCWHWHMCMITLPI